MSISYSNSEQIKIFLLLRDWVGVSFEMHMYRRHWAAVPYGGSRPQSLLTSARWTEGVPPAFWHVLQPWADLFKDYQPLLGILFRYCLRCIHYEVWQIATQKSITVHATHLKERVIHRERFYRTFWIWLSRVLACTLEA